MEDVKLIPICGNMAYIYATPKKDKIANIYTRLSKDYFIKKCSDEIIHKNVDVDKIDSVKLRHLPDNTIEIMEYEDPLLQTASLKNTAFKTKYEKYQEVEEKLSMKLNLIRNSNKLS